MTLALFEGVRWRSYSQVYVRYLGRDQMNSCILIKKADYFLSNSINLVVLSELWPPTFDKPPSIVRLRRKLSHRHHGEVINQHLLIGRPEQPPESLPHQRQIRPNMNDHFRPSIDLPAALPILPNLQYPKQSRQNLAYEQKGHPAMWAQCCNCLTFFWQVVISGPQRTMYACTPFSDRMEWAVLSTGLDHDRCNIFAFQSFVQSRSLARSLGPVIPRGRLGPQTDKMGVLSSFVLSGAHVEWKVETVHMWTKSGPNVDQRQIFKEMEWLIVWWNEYLLVHGHYHLCLPLRTSLLLFLKKEANLPPRDPPASPLVKPVLEQKWPSARGLLLEII